MSRLANKHSNVVWYVLGDLMMNDWEEVEPSNSDIQWFRSAVRASRTHDSGGRYHMVAFVLSGGRVISEGTNSYIKRGKLAGKFTKQIDPELEDLYDNKGVHAELHALIKLLREGKSLSRLTLIVGGTGGNSHNEINTTKPCPVCQTLIEASGVVDTIVFKEGGKVKKVKKVK